MQLMDCNKPHQSSFLVLFRDEPGARWIVQSFRVRLTSHGGLGMPKRYSSDQAVGEHNTQKWGMDVHHPVFWIISILVLLFVIGTIAAPESAKESFDGAKGWSINNFDWLFSVGATSS